MQHDEYFVLTPPRSHVIYRSRERGRSSKKLVLPPTGVGWIWANRKALWRVCIILCHSIFSRTSAGSVGLGEGAVPTRKHEASACKLGLKALIMPDLDSGHQIISFLLSENPLFLIFFF